MFTFLFKHYSLLESRTFRWMFSIIGPVLTFFYILTKKPFGFGLFPANEQMRLALYYSAPVIIFWVIHLFVIQPLVIKKLNILNTLTYLVWIHLFIGFYYYSFSEIYIFGGMFDFYWLPLTLKMTLTMGTFVTSVLISIHAGYLIRKKLLEKKSIQEAKRLN